MPVTTMVPLWEIPCNSYTPRTTPTIQTGNREAATLGQNAYSCHPPVQRASKTVCCSKLTEPGDHRHFENRVCPGVIKAGSRYSSEQVSNASPKCGIYPCCRPKLYQDAYLAPFGLRSHDVRSDMTRLRQGLRDSVKLMLKWQTSAVCPSSRISVLALPTPPHSFVSLHQYHHHTFMPRHIVILES